MMGMRIDEGDLDAVGLRLIDTFDGYGGAGGFVLVVIYTEPHP